MRYQHVNVVIVGAGINGLCTAWQLAGELDGAEIVLVDRFPPGHTRGSSHGEERITRSSYESAAWVAASTRSRTELWPALEATLGQALVVPGTAVLWGPENGPLPLYAAACRMAGSGVEEVDVATARARFPHMTFAGAERVLHDHLAGVIAAARTMRGLEAWLDAAGVRRVQGTVAAIVEDSTGVLVTTADDAIRAEAVVVTAGPWVGALVPALRDRAAPLRQHVGYWQMDAQAGRTPPWVHLGKAGLHYGLPTLAGGVMKAAKHRVVGPGDDPDAEVDADLAELDEVGVRLADWFAPGPGSRLHADTCFFTAVADEAFILEEPPGQTRVLAVSACSGHAFKLAPLTGEAAARWAVRVAG
ncbi:MAG: FAD-dependent oxidoreductase [Myxococcales bacterium]|nr:FAD-dependent oxidoreductase [Myxococcales bacterium]